MKQRLLTLLLRFVLIAVILAILLAVLQPGPSNGTGTVVFGFLLIIAWLIWKVVLFVQLLLLPRRGLRALRDATSRARLRGTWIGPRSHERRRKP